MAIPTPRVIGFALLIALATQTGCARQKYIVRDAAAGDKDFATVRSLKVSEDASRLEIVADKPLVYTYYKTSDPPKAIIDISQTDPGDFIQPIAVNAGSIKTVKVVKRDVGSGVLTRIEIHLLKDVDFSASLDPQDKAKLLVSVDQQVASPAGASGTEVQAPPGNTSVAAEKSSEQAKPLAGTSETATVASKPVQAEASSVPSTIPAAIGTSAAAPGEAKEAGPLTTAQTVSATAQETTPAAAAAAQAGAGTEPQAVVEAPAGVKAVTSEDQHKPSAAAPAGPALTSVKKGDSAIELVVDGGVSKYEVFSLPDRKGGRIIVDLFGVSSKISGKPIPIGSFGIQDARLGVSPGKVRVVLDGTRESINSYRAVKTESGLIILLGKRASSDDAPVPVPSPATKEGSDIVKGPEAAAKKPELEPSAPQAAAPAVLQPEPGAKAEGKAEAANAESRLTSVAVVEGGVDISVAGGVESYKAFMLDNPQRLVIDLFAVKSNLKDQVLPVNSFGVAKARIGSSPEKVRIVLDGGGEKLPAYQITKKQDGLNIRFGQISPKPAESPAAQKEAAPATMPVVPAPAQAAKTGEPILEALDFKLLDNGYSRISFTATGACSVGQPLKVKDGLSLTIKSCRLPKKLQRMLDTGSFASVVKSITPYTVKTRSGHDIRLLARLRDNATYTLKQEGETFNWDIKNTRTPAPRAEKVKAQPPAPQLSQDEETEYLAPPPPVTKPAIPEAKPATTVEIKQPAPEPKVLAKKYTGRKVTLEFSDADVRKIFQLIAEVSNLNFLIADDVSGTISLKLVNVPWDQALDVILESKNLEMKREGNIVQIKPRGRFKTQEQEEGEARRIREKQMEVQTVVIPINYATVGEVKAQLDSLRSTNDKAKIVEDPRTNRVIITDIAPSIEKMRDIIKTLDVPEKQVMIEARIVEASSSFARDLGVQWGLRYNDGTASIAGINGLTSTFGGIVSNVLPSGNTGGIATGLSFGKLASNVQLDLRLSAAATTGLIKIVSTPKVVTLNNKAAKISQGQSIPYQTTSAEGTKTEFIEAALVLDVTPHITADGSIGMKIKASNNSPGSGTPPPINKKEAVTELQLKDGETTVIGGIYIDSETENDTGVPYLKDIPLLGWLFKSNSQSKIKSELLIFITPRILS